MRSLAKENGLTVKQRRFCEAFLRTGVGSEAYREAYATKASPHVVANEANKLLSLPHVKAEIERLQGQVAEAAKITLEEIAANLRYVVNEAKADGNLGEVTRASMGLARITGLDKTTFVEDKSREDVSEEEALRRMMKAHRKLAELDPSHVVRMLRNWTFLDERVGRLADELERTDPWKFHAPVAEIVPFERSDQAS